MTKITVDKAAMQAAFDDLVLLGRMANIDHTERPVMKALRAALAEPVGEPVAHINSNGVVHAAGYPWESGEVLTPLYTSPPPPAEVPLLTDREITEAWNTLRVGTVNTKNDFARAIEQAVRQKAGL